MKRLCPSIAGREKDCKGAGDEKAVAKSGDIF